MKQILAIALVFGCILSTFSQNSLNDYKYVIVPYKYDFLNEKDKYQLNALSQFLFNKYGFNAIMEDAYFPDDLIKNRCLGLKSDIIKESGMFKTKLKVQLKNCNGDIVYTTKSGTSKEKQFKTAYTLALREAFKEFETVNYKYQPNEAILAKASTASGKDPNKEIEKLKEEINTLKQKQAEVKEVPKNKIVVETKNPKTVTGRELKKEDPAIDVLYAQKTDYGYQIVDKAPSVIMILLKTPKTDVFLVKDTNAIVYKEDGFWYLSKNDDGKATIKTLNIKF